MAGKWDLYWSPEGRKIATVEAVTANAAIRKAPQPYRKCLGEVYALPAIDVNMAFNGHINNASVAIANALILVVQDPENQLNLSLSDRALLANAEAWLSALDRQRSKQK